MRNLIRFILLAVLVTAFSTASFGGIFFSVTIAPPLLPVYYQPICPGPGYLWVPGYWAYGDFGYFWVPGTWVLPPFVGALWTPGYWGWANGFFLWHEGFWGPEVGFYGGIDYGFGYPGFGYFGGYWNHDRFFYNTVVNNVNTTIIHNVYNRQVANNNAAVSRVSFNGGRGGITARPTTAQLAATRMLHSAPVAAQTQLRRTASSNRAQWASVNHGRPAVAATPRPRQFTAHTTTPPDGRMTARAPAGARPAANTRTNRAPANRAVARQQPAVAARNAARPNQMQRRTPAAAPRYNARANPAQRRPTTAPQRPNMRPNQEQRRPSVAPQGYSARTSPVQRRPAMPPSHNYAHATTPRPVAPHYRGPVHSNASPSNFAMRRPSPQYRPAPRPAAPMRPAFQQHQSAPRMAPRAPAPQNRGGRRRGV